MKSEFERSAAQSAVDAVEARWKRNQDLLHRQKSRKRLQSCFATLVLAALAAAGAWVFLGGGNLEMPQSPSAFLDTLKARFATKSDSVDSQKADEYGRRLISVLTTPVRLVKDLPASENPRRASSGATFYALSADDHDGILLFALSPDGKGGLSAARCSPFREDCPIPWQTFEHECRKPYLVGIEGCAYLCGSLDLQDAETLKAKVHRIVAK